MIHMVMYRARIRRCRRTLGYGRPYGRLARVVNRVWRRTPRRAHRLPDREA
jgi:hypothetical protein